MDDTTETKVMRLLSKETLRTNLAKAGLYALAYELLKNSIVETPRKFFTMGGSDADDHYKSEVLSKHKNILMASCLWFLENGAITEDDIKAILEFREHRNYIAHELPNVLLNPEVQVDENKLLRLFKLLCKIDRWWIAEFEIPTNPDFDGHEIVPDEIRSGSTEFVSYLIRAVYDLDTKPPPQAS